MAASVGANFVAVSVRELAVSRLAQRRRLGEILFSQGSSEKDSKMDEAARQLRRAIAELGRRRGRKAQVPAAIHDGLCKYVRRHRAGGIDRKSVGRAVGV